MKAILAIAWLSWRAAIRTRLLPVLTGTVILAVVVMPLSLKGDGTLAGQLRILLTYSVGAAWATLAIATLWVSCGQISREVSDRSLRLVVVKPVRSGQIWLGKWIAIVAINGMMLGLVAVSVLTLQAVIRSTTPAADASDAEAAHAIIAARGDLPPELPSIEPEAIAMVNDWVNAGKMPDTEDAREAAMGGARSRVLAKRATVLPGRTNTWHFSMPASYTRHVKRTAEMWLQFTYSSSPLERRKVNGTWLISTEGQRVMLPATNLFDGQHTIPLPDTVVAALPAEGPGTLDVAFVNGHPTDSIAVMFDTMRPATLLRRGGGFVGNLIRAMIVILAFEAALAAVGLTMSTLFAPPVAMFTGVGTALAIVIANSRIARELDGLRVPEEGFAGWLNTVGEVMLVGVRTISAPAFSATPIRRLTEGLTLTWATTGQTWVVLAILYPILLGAFSSIILSRRELAS